MMRRTLATARVYPFLEPMTYPVLTLKRGRDNSVFLRHPWIFSGAIERPSEEVTHGSIVQVDDETGRTMATGSYSAKSMIAVRVFAFGKAVIDAPWLRQRITDALERRDLAGVGFNERNTGQRVVFGESDGIPGLVVDRYGDVVVVQIGTAGIEGLKGQVIGALVEELKPSAIYERSELPSRTEEGLSPTKGLLYGTMPEEVRFVEDRRVFTADVVNGQKTGFFLDQRDLRREVAQVAEGRRVVDLFSYRGAAGITALSGGAEHVLCVDSSALALAAVASQTKLNELDATRIGIAEADVFQWLNGHSEPEFGMVLLDPPALIKSRKHTEDGRKGYHFLNRAAMRILRDRGILVTSSCSQYFPEEDFLVTLRRAAIQAGVELHVIKMVRQAADHPVGLYFPESSYLKSFVCLVRR